MADTQGLGPCARKGLEVQILSWAPEKQKNRISVFLFNLDPTLYAKGGGLDKIQKMV